MQTQIKANSDSLQCVRLARGDRRNALGYPEVSVQREKWMAVSSRALAPRRPPQSWPRENQVDRFNRHFPGSFQRQFGA